MSLTITHVGTPEFVQFKDGASMDKFAVTLSDGTSGDAWRPIGSEYPPAVGDEVTIDSKGKVSKVKKEGTGGYAGGGSKASDPTVDKKITRMHAQKVAAEIFNPVANKEDFVNLCDQLCEDVYAYAGSGGVPIDGPAPEPEIPEDPLKVARQQLAAQAAAEQIPDSVIGVVLNELTGQTTMSLAAIPMIPAILQKAKAKMAPAPTDDIPF